MNIILSPTNVTYMYMYIKITYYYRQRQTIVTEVFINKSNKQKPKKTLFNTIK